MMKAVLLIICVMSSIGALAAIAQDPIAKSPVAPAIVQSAEDKFSTEIAKAEAELAKVKRAAAEARLKVYRDKLTEATKAGDFDKAVALKARITDLEADPEAQAQKKPRPKDTVRFQGHTYAVIKEPATWHVAKQRCEEMGGHLVCINSGAESEFVAKLCEKNLTAIGVSDELEEGAFLNIDGSKPVFAAAPIDAQHALDHWVVWDGNRFVVWQAGGRAFYVCEWNR